MPITIKDETAEPQTLTLGEARKADRSGWFELVWSEYKSGREIYRSCRGSTVIACFEASGVTFVREDDNTADYYEVRPIPEPDIVITLKGEGVRS